MMWRLARRSLTSRPVRTAVLAAGFGFGIAVMAELLGVGHVMVEQARSPSLAGGGDLVAGGPNGSIQSARFLMTTIAAAPDLNRQVRAISPTREERLFLMTASGSIPITATGGVPSLEKAIGDPEVSNVAAWTDEPVDQTWSRPDAGDILRAMDRFHRIPASAGSSSALSGWAEWLYFNARTTDGRVRLYLTFMVGPSAGAGKRSAGVRLQLERDGSSTAYSASGDVDESIVLAHAPNLEIAGNQVRLVGTRYHLRLALSGPRPPDRLTGELVLDSIAGRSLPPATIRGARNWVTGYVVPVLAGKFSGSLSIGGETIPISDAPGYHDHNWGFWRDVSWQWGQVAHDDMSIVYGRVFPPADVADPSRLPGFLAVLGPDGPLGFSTDVTIDDHALPKIAVTARGRQLDLQMEIDVEESERTPMSLTAGTRGLNDFLQLGGRYRVTGRAGGRPFDFEARGSAETFRPH